MLTALNTLPEDRFAAGSDRKAAFYILFQQRETGFEPTTTCLEGRGSSAELLPHGEYNMYWSVRSLTTICSGPINTKC